MCPSRNETAATLRRLTASVQTGSPPKADLIELARLGPAAIDLAPAILGLIPKTKAPHVRSLCLEALKKAVEDSPHENAKFVADVLAGWLIDPEFRRQRTRILLTLAFAGRVARGALPTMLTLRHGRGTGRFRQRLRGAFHWILRGCLESGDDEEQAQALEVIPRAGIWQGICLLRDFLAAPRATPERIRDARALLATMEERERRIEAARQRFLDRFAEELRLSLEAYRRRLDSDSQGQAGDPSSSA